MLIRIITSFEAQHTVECRIAIARAIDPTAALRQAEIICSAHRSGACQSMVAGLREQLAERQARQYGLPRAR